MLIWRYDCSYSWSRPWSVSKSFDTASIRRHGLNVTGLSANLDYYRPLCIKYNTFIGLTLVSLRSSALHHLKNNMTCTHKQVFNSSSGIMNIIALTSGRNYQSTGEQSYSFTSLPSPKYNLTQSSVSQKHLKGHKSYASSERWINNISIDVWFGQYLVQKGENHL